MSVGGLGANWQHIMAKHQSLIALLLLMANLGQLAHGFNLFEFLGKFSQSRPVYQPPPPQQLPAKRFQQNLRRPSPQWPQLQYNYDQPQQDNLVEDHPPEQPQYSYSQQTSQHYEAYEPEQPADIPIIIGKILTSTPPPRRFVTTTTTPFLVASTTPYHYPDYHDIEIITAPPLRSSHVANTYEVQVGTNFNTRH